MYSTYDFLHWFLFWQFGETKLTSLTIYNNNNNKISGWILLTQQNNFTNLAGQMYNFFFFQ